MTYHRRLEEEKYIGCLEIGNFAEGGFKEVDGGLD